MEKIDLDFQHDKPSARPAYQKPWWKLTVLFLSGTSLFLILTLLSTTS